MLRIAFSTLSARKGGMLGAFAAVALAVTLVVSCGILLESSLRAPIPVERLAAAGAVVQADPTFDGNASVLLSERKRLPAGLAARLRGVPGVAAAIADRSFPLQATDRHARLLTGRDGAGAVGHGWASARLTPLVLGSGRPPASARDVVLSADLAARAAIHVGDRIRIATATTRASFTVAGIAATRSGHPMTREAPVFFRDDVARRISGTGGRVDLIALVLTPGADAGGVARRADAELEGTDLRVLTGAGRGEAESQTDALGREDTVAGLTVFALLAAFVAIFVVGATFALSVQQRHREFALFRAIGSTPRQVRRMVAGEALLISLAAVAIAAPVSLLAARLEQTLFTRVDMLPAGLDIVIGWLPFAAGLVVAVVTTQLAAFASARRASRIRPTDALRESTIQRRAVSLPRGLAGVAAAAGGVAVLAASGSGRESTAPASAVVWMVAVALLGPLLARPFTWLIGSPLSAISRGPGLLARANTGANLRRVASVATPLMLAVSLVCTLYFGKTMLEQQTTKQTSARTTADYVLGAGTSAGLPADITVAARRVPGVAQASGSFATTVIVAADGTNLNKYPARAVDAATLAGVLDLGISAGSLADLRGASLAVSTDRARQFGWRTGERVDVLLGDGTPITLRVAATYARPLGFADILLPRALAAPHVTQALDDAIFVAGRPGADRRTLANGLERLRRANPDLVVETSTHYEHALADAAHKQSLAVYALLGLIAVFCALAAVNAVMMSTAERAREFALLRLVGAGKRQIGTMVRAETLIMVAFGLVVGSLIAAPGLALFSRELTGSAIPSGPFWIYGALVSFFAALAFAASSVSTRLALRMDPVKAMAARQ